MPYTNGPTARIFAYLRKHPGATARELGIACGFDHLNGLLSHLRKRQRIFAAGPRGWSRHYLDAETARQHHDAVCALAEAHKLARTRSNSRVCGLRRRERRIKEGSKPRRTKPNAIAADVLVSHDVRVTIAPPPPPRWVPEGFVGEFQREWQERRA